VNVGESCGVTMRLNLANALVMHDVEGYGELRVAARKPVELFCGGGVIKVSGPWSWGN